MYDTHESCILQTLVQEQIDSWRAGEEPNASRLLAEHPELRNAKSLVMDLALAEYTLRIEAGDKIVKHDFCDRFPAYRQSIAKLLEVQEFLDQCPQFAVHDASRWPIPGDDFLDFEIVEPLGRGGLARVFLARELSLGNRQVVVKVSRFASREAHTLGKLSHPSIMPVYSVQRDDVEGWTAICMPLVGAATGVDLLDAAFADGATRDAELVHCVAESTRPLAAATTLLPPSEQFDWDLTYQQAIGRLGLQLAEALSAAHATGILHRDIKPSNILLAWSGRPLLLDFNLSSDTATTLQGVGGTLAYMAPELIASVLTDKGHAAKQFDPRYDIYSLGAVLYELLTGHLPAKPANADSLPIDAYQPWLDCKSAQIPAVATADEADPVHQPLHNIVLKCLAFDPAERFANADELATALRNYLDSSKPAPVVQKSLAPQAMSTKRFAALAALVALATLVLVAFGFRFSGSQTTRIAPPELLYQQGLDEYHAGQYATAIDTFTLCLERKPGWSEARFARAQTLRKLEKWYEAREDYISLRKFDPAWANTLAGYCSMMRKDDLTARGSFIAAYRYGQRDLAFLFNFARVRIRLQSAEEALESYADVLAQEPENRVAIFNRCLLGVGLVRNDKKKIPSPECMVEAESFCRLASDTFDAPFCAAVVFGEAARKDPAYRHKAVGYLTEAIEKGLPLDIIEASVYQTQLQPLLGYLDKTVIAQGINDPNYRVSVGPTRDFPPTPDWEEFRNPDKRRASRVARGMK